MTLSFNALGLLFTPLPCYRKAAYFIDDNQCTENDPGDPEPEPKADDYINNEGYSHEEPEGGDDTRESSHKLSDMVLSMILQAQFASFSRSGPKLHPRITNPSHSHR